jgi:hypothetical protein
VLDVVLLEARDLGAAVASAEALLSPQISPRGIDTPIDRSRLTLSDTTVASLNADSRIYALLQLDAATCRTPAQSGPDPEVILYHSPHPIQLLITLK